MKLVLVALLRLSKQPEQSLGKHFHFRLFLLKKLLRFPNFGLFSKCLCMDSILKSDNSVEAVLQYSPVVLFIIMLYKVALTFESVDEILKFDYSNKSY